MTHFSALNRYLPALTLLMLLPAWEVICRSFDVPAYLFPSPSLIFESFMEVEPARWLEHLWATLRVALLGFGLSLMISIPLAMLMVNSQYLSKTLYPFLVIVQSTPVVAIAPLLITMFGSGEAPRLAITCLITFFPLVVSAMTGMLATPPELIDLSRSLRAPRYKEVLAIRLPYSLPHIFSGMKVAITLSIIGAVVAEFVAAEQGLGYFIQFSTSFFKVPQAFAALIFLSLISLALFKLVHWIQSYFFGWTLTKGKA
ncbi:ABC transporter permease [Alteromonas aestuariivivens]|uniref:ABC transporter permease n=1 Tax=Alteromonas aestuariivivens TaxID=1938339 RepID=A0A3D8MF25_9ALTE|nr:ABC transporter permease [Alteromonas aestuariivivens]RDV29226.1 ABC transporter permease [Alteromonas aestuariivivens]